MTGTCWFADTLLGDLQTRAFIKGVVNTEFNGKIVTISSGGQLGVLPLGQLGALPSSARYKQDIYSMAADNHKVYELRPVTFHYKAEPRGPLQYGLIAEEVAQVYPELVTRDADGKIAGVRYEGLTPLLLNELQQQHRQMAAQNQQLTAQNQQLQTVLQQLAELTDAERFLTGRGDTVAGDKSGGADRGDRTPVAERKRLNQTTEDSYTL